MNGHGVISNGLIVLFMFLFIAIAAYFFLAMANVIDKIVITKLLAHEAVYAFYVCVMGLGIILITPFVSIALPSIGFALLCLLAGILFGASLFFLYGGLRYGEVSIVAPLVGGLVPLMLLIAAAVLPGYVLSKDIVIAVLVLLLGFAVLVWTPQMRSASTKMRKGVRYALLSGVSFAGHYLLAEKAYYALGFLNGFFWVRIGAGVAALIIFLIPVYRTAIIADLAGGKKKKQPKGKWLVAGNQLLGAIGFICQNYAIAISSSVIVTSLQGLKYGFVFLMAIIGGRYATELKEDISRRMVIQKIAGITLIGIGIALLV